MDSVRVSQRPVVVEYKYLCMGCKDAIVILHHSQYFRTVYCDECLDNPREDAV